MVQFKIHQLIHQLIHQFTNSPTHQFPVRSHPLLFEISAWPWLERLSRAEHRDVTLATVPGRCWDRVAADGFDAVFLMGVWRRSPSGRAIARSERSLIAAYDRVLPVSSAAATFR